jgi:hypothetical protein
MDEMSKRKILIRRIAIGILLFLCLYLAFLKPLFKFERSRLLDEEIENRASRLESFSIEVGELPSEELFERLRKEVGQLDSEYKELISFIDPSKARLPEGASEAGLYFIERLHTLGKELERKAQVLGVSLPKTMGFSEDLPPSDMVGLLLRELEMVEESVQALIEKEVNSISLIKPLSPMDKNFYTELPLQLSFICDTDCLVKFLQDLKNKSPMYVVKDLHITPEVEEEKLKVDLIVSGLVVK